VEAVSTILEERRRETKLRTDKLIALLADAEALCNGKACVYSTGSFARGEAHEWSDLDLFIVGTSTQHKRDLRRLDEIRIKADLIEATQKEGIPEFSGDGRYLDHYTVHELTSTLGKPEDDVTNTFTARLLLLLESRPLLEPIVYRKITEDVVSAYWIDYIDHKSDFTPAFLANDILRLWRTFCVNYEARTLRVPDIEKAKRKLKNYKLKYSRQLTCYSALLYLLALHTQKGTVSPEDAAQMITLSPTERLEWLLGENGLSSAHTGVRKLISSYETFLQNTAQPESVLIEIFLDRTISKQYFAAAASFGDQMFEVIEAIGQRQRLHRLLVV
jgi:predicted nucleotidyltransferase